MASTLFKSSSRIIVPSTEALYKSFATSVSSSSQSYKLPSLPYDYSSLEPAISAKIMETHHSKHHQTYVNNLNATLQQYGEAEQKGDLTKQLSLQNALRFNGGGHLNHSIFWTNLAPIKAGGGDFNAGGNELKKYVEKDFGSFEELKTKLSAASLAVQGSGKFNYRRK